MNDFPCCAPQTPSGETAPGNPTEVSSQPQAVSVSSVEHSGSRPAVPFAEDQPGLSVLEQTRDAIAVLRDGDVVLGSGEIDYAVASMLEVLVELHVVTGIDLEGLPQVGRVAQLIVHGWDL